MTKTKTAAENAMPHQTAHRTKKNVLTVDLDHSIVPYHTHVNRTTTKLTSVRTRAAAETNGQNEQNDTSEQGRKIGGTTDTEISRANRTSNL
jgi:hypothetical protein